MKNRERYPIISLILYVVYTVLIIILIAYPNKEKKKLTHWMDHLEDLI